MKNKKSIIVLLIVAIIGIVGLTLAYFSNSDTIENQFITKEYGTTYNEEFVSPDNWLPGDTTDKTIVVENTGEVDEAVRISYTESWTTHNNGTLNGWIHPDGTKSTHTTETELSTDESVAILNLANTSDWTKVGDYYYYNYKLAPGESTSSFLESVTFNSKTKLDDTCVTTIDGSTKTVTCNSSGDDYDNATYTLTFTIETVQYNKYSEAWGISATIVAEKQVSETFAQHIISNANEASITNYTDGVTSEAYTFNHEATEQTGALTDYRYIGNTPNNYVYFNCTDESDTSTCETWRIIGVFNVDDGTGTFENRVKLVRGSSFADAMYWNNGSYNNDWTDANASLKNFLNGEYYNRTGDAVTYGLKESARGLIDDAVFYLGGTMDPDETRDFGSTEEVYAWERGNMPCGACNSDVTKLTWTGKVGLMYPSDEYMVYGNGVNVSCYSSPSGCSGTNAQTGWVYNSNILEGQTSKTTTWLLSPDSDYTVIVSRVYSGGFLSFDAVDYDTYGVRPVVYLKSSVKITDGTGEETNPYVLEEM